MVAPVQTEIVKPYLRLVGDPSGFGDFLSTEINDFAPRAKAHQLWDIGDAAQRDEMRKSLLQTVSASAEGAATKEAPGKRSSIHNRSNIRGWVGRSVDSRYGNPNLASN
jgi:hypothetical protein